jgi:N5-(cytidine 5'-diphosphoramidyl)-L-glutamine hydrolase
MKLLGITQRVENVPVYKERRDCLDQRWWKIIFSIGLIPVPLPNVPSDQIETLLNELNVSAILFSGGNSLTFLDNLAADNAPERDQFEVRLLEWAMNLNIPILGVCRGMQLINHSLGGGLVEIQNHVSIKHVVSFCGELATEPNREVNSYHNLGILNKELGNNLRAIAQADDGTIEAFQHISKRIAGIMWHPEREKQINSHDIRLIKKFLL